MTNSGKASLKGTMNGLNACKRQNRTTGAGEMMAPSVAEIISNHVTLSVEGIDRMAVYVARLQCEYGAGSRCLPRR
jgi:hypothetical protein